MINGITFSEQLNTSADFAHFQNVFLNGAEGITKGCDISHVDNAVYVQKGYFVAFGRFVQVVGVEEIEVPEVVSGELYCKVVFEIDLTKNNTEEEFNQGYFKTLTSPHGYPDIMRQDLDDGGTLYQMPWCQYIAKPAGIDSFRDLRPIIDMESIWRAVFNQNGSYKEEFDEYFSGQKETILELIRELEAQSYVKVSDARRTFLVELKATGWTGITAPYIQSVSVEGVTADMDMLVVRALEEGAAEDVKKAYDKAFGMVSTGTGKSDEGIVTFRAYQKPATDITIGLKGV